VPYRSTILFPMAGFRQGRAEKDLSSLAPGNGGAMNPLRGFPGHPSHPPLTDVTIGAYTFATIAAILSKAGVAEHGFAAAWWLALVVGAVSSAATVLTGLLDWLKISGGTPLKRTATVHALTNAAASVFFVISIIVGHHDYTRGLVATGELVLTIVGFALLVAGGTMGGSITYVHGMRVLNLVDEPTRRAIVPSMHEEKERASK
jgi:uncharacterized membrane protein